MSLEYRGIPSTLTNVLGVDQCKQIVNGFAVTKSKTRTKIENGWDQTSPTGFVGSVKYMSRGSTDPNQKTLAKILRYDQTGADNPCITYSTAQGELGGYIAQSQVGAKDGVASLELEGSNKYIPLSQFPSLGSGYVVGPLGVSKTYTDTTVPVSGSSRIKIAEWAIRTNPFNFYPLVFMVVNAKSDNNLGRPFIEVRLSDGQASGYSTLHPLMAMGTGRSFFTAMQTINVLPCAPTNNRSGSPPYPSTYDIYLTAWLGHAGIGTSSINNNSIVGASAFLMQSNA